MTKTIGYQLSWHSVIHRRVWVVLGSSRSFIWLVKRLPDTRATSKC